MSAGPTAADAAARREDAGAAERARPDATADAATDALLVDLVLHGDADAYGELVSRHMRRAFAIAFRILEQREDAEDVVQDAFIRALERLDRLDQSRPFAPWLYRIVVNTALNFRRGRSLRATRPVPENARSTTTSPETDADRSLLAERLRQAMALLPQKQRVILLLSDLEGMSGREIADIVGIPAGTARWHLHQARAAMRRLLGSMEEAR